MSIEKALTQLLGPLCADQVYWDVIPEGYRVTTPVVICQQVGGSSWWYVEGETPTHKNSRIQIVVWGFRRADVNALIRLIENTICKSGLVAQPEGAFVADYDEPLKLFGARQHFEFWYPDP